MSRSLAVAGIGFTIVLLGLGAAVMHPMPQTLFIAVVPSPHDLGFLAAAMTFVVAAVIDHDR